jgi:arylformamidase
MQTQYLSHFLEESTPVYGGIEGSIQMKKVREIQKGDTSNNLEFLFPGHSGTHIDFPLHFKQNGKSCSDYPAGFWLFSKVGFLDCSIEQVPGELSGIAGDIELLILKTGFGKERGQRVYWEQQPVMPSAYAKLFRSHFPRLRVFGFDLISLTSKLDRGEGKKAHMEFLLENEILVLEDMNLTALAETPSNVIIAPLLVKSADGVPCNVIAY